MTKLLFNGNTLKDVKMSCMETICAITSLHILMNLEVVQFQEPFSQTIFSSLSTALKMELNTNSNSLPATNAENLLLQLNFQY